MSIKKKNILPLSIAATIYLLSYQIPKILVNPSDLHFVSIPLDNVIPLFSPSIVIYFAAFFQWLYAFYVLLTHETKIAYKYATAVIIGSLIGFACFMLYPTAMHRVEITGTSIFDQILKIVYSIDNIICALPSFHCFLSTLVIYVFYETKVDKKILIFNIILSILVYASTLLTKQHYFLDVPSGILLGILSATLVKVISFNGLFEKLNKNLK